MAKICQNIRSLPENFIYVGAARRPDKQNRDDRTENMKIYDNNILAKYIYQLKASSGKISIIDSNGSRHFFIMSSVVTFKASVNKFIRLYLESFSFAIFDKFEFGKYF